MSKFLFPVFISTPEALDWLRTKDWSRLIKVESEQDAVRFIKQFSPEPIPIWRVEMRIADTNMFAQTMTVIWLKRININPEPHDPSEAWEKGKWETGFEAYVGGDRRFEYPDEKKWELLKP